MTRKIPVSNPERRLIVVLGVHRGGTSVVTRGLRVMGVQLGDRLMPAVEGNNPTGFWEDLDLNALNIEMLKSLGSEWHHLAPIEPGEVEALRKNGYFLRAVELLRQKVGHAASFGFKDPRATKLLPFWKEVFRHCQLDVSYVLALRHPLSVVKSLSKRDGFDAEKSHLLWLGHMTMSLSGTTGEKRVLVDYDRLMQSPDRQLYRIAKHLDLRINPRELQYYKTAFLDQGLRHTIYDLRDLLLDDACPPLVREIYATLLDVASDKTRLDDRALQNQIAHWAGEFERIKSPLTLADRLSTQKAAANQAVAERDGRIVTLNQAMAERDGQIAALSQAVTERDTQVAAIGHAIVERDRQIANLNQAVAERDGQVANLNQAVTERDGQITSLNQAVAERDGQIASLKQTVAERDGQVASLTQTVVEREAQAASLNQTASDLRVQVTALNEAVMERDGQISNLNQVVTERDGLSKSLEEIYKSTSWRVTKPIRILGRQVKRARVIYRFFGNSHATLTAIYASHGWKALAAYHKIRNWILPAGSRRKKVAEALGMVILRPIRFPTRDDVRKSVLYLRTYGFGALARKVGGRLHSNQENLFHRPAVPTLKISRMKEKRLRHADDSAVSVIIPTKNAGSEFEYLLAMLAKQRGIKSVEVIVVDSGSTDSTVEIGRNAGAKVIEILPENFSHSYARNLGADSASGKYLLFTVQDALPPSEVWLYELFRALRSGDVVAVSCTESPREDVDLLYRVLTWNHRRFLEIESGDRILSRPASQEYVALRKNSQLSDVACLIDKTVFAKYRYRYDYAEDLDLGVRLIGDGYKLAILGSTSVIHSHARPCSYYLKRWYAETLTMPKIIPSFPVPRTEYDALMADIMFTYDATTAVAANGFGGIGSLCKAADIAATLRGAFASAPRFAPPHGVYPKEHGYVDDAFDHFLNAISISAPPASLSGTYDGALWNSLGTFMESVGEYLNSSTEVLGVDEIQGVKECMYKAFAFLCGTHLAFCYLGGDERTKGLMRAMHRDLIRGI